MALWIEVKARYDKMGDNGTVSKVTESYLVDALTCTEAEARVTEELRPLISGDLSITSTAKTNIAEIFFSETTDERWYKVKVNFITLNEKTGKEKRNASYIVVNADDFADALGNFRAGMKGTMADYEIEAIAETKYIDVYPLKLDETSRAEKD